MVYVAVVLGVLVLSVLLMPFFVGPGGVLAAGASIKSPERLRAIKEALIRRYLEDERAFQEGTLSKLAWEKRRRFLTHRYIDAARRLDYLQAMRKTHADGVAS